MFFDRLKDCYLQEFRYSTPSKVKEYMHLGIDVTKYNFQNFLEEIKDIEHRHVFVGIANRNQLHVY